MLRTADPGVRSFRGTPVRLVIIPTLVGYHESHVVLISTPRMRRLRGTPVSLVTIPTLVVYNEFLVVFEMPQNMAKSMLCCLGRLNEYLYYRRCCRGEEERRRPLLMPQHDILS